MSLFSSTVYAVSFCSSTESSQSNSDNQVYAGLVWEFGNQNSFEKIPQLTLGIRSLHVKSSDSVNGADANIRIKIKDGLSIDSTRINYVGGNRDTLGNLGLGYSFKRQSLIGVGAIQSPYLRLGSDFILKDKSLNPFIETLTVDSPDKVDKKLVQQLCS
jgi:hypothetical protein